MEGKPIPKKLVEILACPACESRPKVQLRENGVHCSQCGRTYPIENGIPIMLVERATEDKNGGDAR